MVVTASHARLCDYIGVSIPLKNDPVRNDLLKNDRATWLHGSAAECSQKSLGAPEPGYVWRLVLLGAPGVGKGTQAELLTKRLGACHLSTGDVFRAASKQRDCDQSPAMKAATDYMRRGQLVPDSIVWEMVRERSDCILHCGGFILDGFPRTLAQAESLQALMATENVSLTAVVNYELPVEQILHRLSGRRTCEHCKAVFHVTDRPSKVTNKCDHCGGDLYQREDDRVESITVRLEAYERSTAPLIQFYKNMNLLMPIVSEGSPDEIFAGTLLKLTPLASGHRISV
jgi:adenylate kinase